MSSPLPTAARLADLPADPLFTHDYERRRPAVLAALRERHGAVAPVDLLGQPVWLVLDHGEAMRVLTDEERWKKAPTHWRAYREGAVPRDWPLRFVVDSEMVVFFDDERRVAARAAIDAALAPYQGEGAEAERLTGLISGHADSLISFLSAGGGGRGMADLCGQYARPLPLMVANHLLGLPDAEGDDVLMDVWRVLDAGPEAPMAVHRLLVGLRELVEEKRRRPGDDVPSRLLAHAPDASTEEHALHLNMILITTAESTGALLAGSLVHALATNTLAETEPRELIERTAISNPPMQNLSLRFAAADTRLGDVTVAAGDPVIVSPAAAHACPHFTGDEAAPHLAFGAGPHACPARPLAETIVTIGIERVRERFGELTLAMPPDQLPWRVTPLVTGLRSLPVRYSVATPEPGPAAPAVEPSAPERRPAFWRLLATLRGAR
ncbi:cytochrome P450 [Streptomyces sp. 8K308]|uniref:cytochrome P450 n=1 Tax=Streptomyces sp. 8K308 TaxID=2530388 RepID=UPI0010474853|nr:cytochrome P450 [Streptomyces sp. 8K308]TDC27054.1 cytochrome P450 [Streptomyces sp. 8K308]